MFLENITSSSKKHPSCVAIFSYLFNENILKGKRGQNLQQQYIMQEIMQFLLSIHIFLSGGNIVVREKKPYTHTVIELKHQQK